MSSLPLARRRRGIVAYWRVLVALFFRDAAEEDMQVYGVVHRLVEPAIMIFATVMLSWLIMRQPPYGTSMLLWSCTGVSPIYLFVRICRRVTAQRNVSLPFYRDIDLCLVHGCLEFVFVTGAIVMLFAVLYWTETAQAMPPNLGQAAEGWVAIAGFAFGIGLISRTLWRLYRLWHSMFPALLRGLLHLSGVYFVVDFLPPQIRYYLAFNPVINAVTMFRLGFYPSFPTYTYSPGYFLSCTLIALFFGITIEVLAGDRVIRQ